MANEYAGLDAHSAEHFGATRDHWWNEDTLAFLARRWEPARIRTVLDVGCGVGHWSRLLARVLPAEARFWGVDREARWVARASELAAEAGDAARFQFAVGDAEALANATDSFDLVTCQTLLMHLRDPARGLEQMVRVARPGGLVLVAEPTNLVGPFLQDALAAPGADVDALAGLLRLQLLCQRGRAQLGEGDNLLGERVPHLLAAAGLVGVEVRLNDRANVILPPYDTASARASVEELVDTTARDVWCWPRHDTRRYFGAGGGADGDFDGLWATLMAERERVARAFRDGRYASAGGGLFYLAWGRKAS
jgi:SAM-dependent methyltransferase